MTAQVNSPRQRPLDDPKPQVENLQVQDYAHQTVGWMCDLEGYEVSGAHPGAVDNERRNDAQVWHRHSPDARLPHRPMIVCTSAVRHAEATTAHA